MLPAAHTIPDIYSVQSQSTGNSSGLPLHNGLPYLDQYDVDNTSAQVWYEQDLRGDEGSPPPVMKVDNSLTRPDVFAGARLCGKVDASADEMNALQEFLDGLDNSDTREGRLPGAVATFNILTHEGSKVNHPAGEVDYPLREIWNGSGATEPVFRSAHEASSSHTDPPCTTFPLHHHRGDYNARNYGEVPETCSPRGDQESLHPYSKQAKYYGFTDKVAEFDGGSYLSCGYISTVGKFGYEKTAIAVSAKGMIHVLAISYRVFDVTLQRYSGMTPSTTSTSLRGFEIPPGCDSAQDIHALIHQRFDDLPRSPEYYGFSCVIGAYAGEDEQFYARIVAELCRCLYEAMSCQ